MDRFESMLIFVTAAEEGSLSAAARRLGTPLTTVSRKVSELEAHLRTRLLKRSSRRLTLTDAGQSYLAACRRILEDVAEAERTASGEYSTPRGELIITAPVVFGRLYVTPVVAEFLKIYPEIDIRMVLADGVLNLLENRFDLAVRIGHLPDSSLVATRVGAISCVVCASPAYFAGRGVPKSPGDLSAHDCISFERLFSPDVWTFTSGGSRTSVTIHSRLVVDTAEAAIDAAVAGAGVTRGLSYQISAAVRAGALAVVLREFEPSPFPVSLIYAGNKHLPLKVRAFLDFAVPRLKSQLMKNDLIGTWATNDRNSASEIAGSINRSETLEAQREKS
jgi:DNA-binding transcriptional LysR family regulator